MDAARDYIARCLAGCPAGAEEQLLGELTNHLLKKIGDGVPVLVNGQDGPVAYFLPVTAESLYPLDENDPRFAKEIQRRMESRNPPLTAEAFLESLAKSTKEVSAG